MIITIESPGCGCDHKMTIDEDCCGSNEHGQLGFCDNEDRDKLEKVPIDRDFQLSVVDIFLQLQSM